MLTLLKGSNRTETIQIVLKAIPANNEIMQLVDEEGEFIYENEDVKLNDFYAVVKHLASASPLYGTLEEEKKAGIEEWLTYCKTELEIPVSVLTWLSTGKLTHEEVNALAEKKARSDVMLCLRKLEIRLKESIYLVGDEITIADIVIASCLRPLFVLCFGEVERRNSLSVCAWVNQLYASTPFVDAIGQTVLLVSSKKGKK